MTLAPASGEAAIGVLRIEGEMSVYRAEELKRLLHPPMYATAMFEVDLSAVTELDSAGLQLLILAKKAAQASQSDLHLVGKSPAVDEVFELLHLGAYFTGPATVPACAVATVGQHMPTLIASDYR